MQKLKLNFMRLLFIYCSYQKIAKFY